MADGEGSDRYPSTVQGMEHSGDFLLASAAELLAGQSPIDPRAPGARRPLGPAPKLGPDIDGQVRRAFFTLVTLAAPSPGQGARPRSGSNYRRVGWMEPANVGGLGTGQC